MDAYKQSSLWKTAFPDNSTEFPQQRKRIIEAYERFRERVALLLQQIQKELPSLTLHDITHVDALWHVASEIAGPHYPLNPAEALVLGGAFLLHDAAHCRAAYAGGLDEIKKLDEWRDAAARRKLDLDTLTPGHEDFQAVLFDTLRVLHPKQAKTLAFAKWKDTTGDEFLFPDSDLRNAYGDLIGEIAESHWFHPHQLDNFGNSPKTSPSCLAPANWTVDPLKLAVLLRTSDACHLDAKRAPRFLMLLNQPTGISAVHWQFQSKINQVKCNTEREELLITGSPFGPDEQAAWWQAYDAACLADRELSAADALLQDFHGHRLAAREIAGARNPERFAKQIPTKGWYPVDTSLRISNIQSVVERFGGEKLYGDKPWLALRELIQNARDAIHAARSLGYLNEDEGEIEVAIEDADDGHWLHVTDNGIGMSRYVLTEVLLDFGRSLWRSDEVKSEWNGLASSDFEAVGQFGIGFFSVFMLGNKVRVSTRRCEAKNDESRNGWLLEFNDGINQRPILKIPTRSEERKRCGTRISVLVSPEKQANFYIKQAALWGGKDQKLSLVHTCAHLAPAIDINLAVTDKMGKTYAVLANDWIKLSDIQLLQRVVPFLFGNKKLLDYWNTRRQLTEIRATEGRLSGRCAIMPEHFNAKALGVTKGILAGYIDGITGIVISTPQSDLARDIAFPDITKRELKNWANDQAETIVNLGHIDEEASTWLAAYGAEHQRLILGKLGAQEISYTAFCNHLKEIDTLIVYDEEVSYEDDDPVNFYQLEEFFTPNKNLLTFLAEEWTWSAPEWLGQLPQDGIDDSSWSMQSALKTAIKSTWGEEGCWRKEQKSVAVGKVGDFTIMRICDVYTRDTLST